MSEPFIWPLRLTHPSMTSGTPPAANVLGALLDKLSSASAQGRRDRLGVVRTLTDKGGA